MSRRTSSAYGSNRLALWYHGLRDRVHGEHARANARWGHLRAPQARGRLIWIKAGGTRDSVRVAVELLRALRERRLDVRLVLTFEQDYPDLMESALDGLQKVGVGYGPCGARAAVRRTFARLQPFGLICVDHEPGPAVYEEARRHGIHSVAYLSEPAAAPVEAAYPLDADQAGRWAAQNPAAFLAPPADPLAQLVEAQVEPTFRVLVKGAAEPRLGWAHLRHPEQLQPLAAAWRAWPGQGDSVLFVSCDAGAALNAGPGGGAVRRLSAWQREPIAPGTLVLVDEPRWSPALAVSADAVWYCGCERGTRWQALAGGVPVIFGAADARPPEAPAELPVDPDPAAFLRRWSALLEQPLLARRIGDAGRRRVWEERRRSAEVVEALLQRVYDW